MNCCNCLSLIRHHLLLILFRNNRLQKFLLGRTQLFVEFGQGIAVDFAGFAIQFRLFLIQTQPSKSPCKAASASASRPASAAGLEVSVSVSTVASVTAARTPRCRPTGRIGGPRCRRVGRSGEKRADESCGSPCRGRTGKVKGKGM